MIEGSFRGRFLGIFQFPGIMVDMFMLRMTVTAYDSDHTSRSICNIFLNNTNYSFTFFK